MICICREKLRSTFFKFFFDFQCPACVMLGLMNIHVPAVVFHAFERKTEFEHSKSKAIYENPSLVTC